MIRTRKTQTAADRFEAAEKAFHAGLRELDGECEKLATLSSRLAAYLEAQGVTIPEAFKPFTPPVVLRALHEGKAHITHTKATNTEPTSVETPQKADRPPNHMSAKAGLMADGRKPPSARLSAAAMANNMFGITFEQKRQSDEDITTAMANALLELFRLRGEAVTEQDLKGQFSEDEITRLGPRASRLANQAQRCIEKLGQHRKRVKAVCIPVDGESAR